MKRFTLIDESMEMVKENVTVLRKCTQFIQKNIIERTGYRISKIDLNKVKPKLDVRHVATDPIEAVYRAGSSHSSMKNKWVVMNVPMDRTRRFPMGFGIDGQYSDPFAQTVRDYVDGSHVSYEGSALEKYYRSWQPQNIAELLGLNPDKSNEALLKTPAFGVVYPWDFESPAQRVEKNAQWFSCGPVGKDNGSAEYDRYIKMADSIMSSGYHRNTDFLDMDIGAQVLASGSEWRILIHDGNHRFSALQGLGWTNIPVCLRRWPMIIRREDVLSWPNVVNSLFDVNSAMKIFDQFFNARQPSTYSGYE